jgi:hypothetical protein
MGCEFQYPYLKNVLLTWILWGKVLSLCNRVGDRKLDINCWLIALGFVLSFFGYDILA